MMEERRLRVFISSPGDVEEERRRAALVLNRLRREFARFFELSPVLWEYEPLLASGHFQDCIIEPSNTDIVVVILWSRLGTPLPEKTEKREYCGLDGRVPVTGTEWEYEEALQASRMTGIPDILVYRKDIPGHASGRTAAELRRAAVQLEALEEFWERHFQNREGQFIAAHYRFSCLDQFEILLEQHLRELLLRKINAARKDAAKQRVVWPECPFRGLRSFDFEHSAIFFGRARTVNAVIEALIDRAGQGCAFVLVLGASGSGKSSLVKAGVVPALLAPGVFDSGLLWRHAVFQPGGTLVGDLFERLLAALTPALPELSELGATPEELAAQLRDGEPLTLKLALKRATETRPEAASRLVLVVDQLEEIFSLPIEERERFAMLLNALARSGAIWLIATMRSDFFHRLVELEPLHHLAAGKGAYLLGPPRPEEIQQMIEQPARAAGLSFEADSDEIRLDAVLREEASAHPAALPLLEFALEALYYADIAQGRVLRYDSYRNFGGLEGAIASKAEAAFERLSEDARAALPTVLWALVSVSDDGSGPITARRASLSQFAAATPARRLIDTFLDPAARLLSIDQTDVRVAHEALLTHWKRARERIERDRSDLQRRHRMDQAVKLWQGYGQDNKWLLQSDQALAEAREMLRRHGDKLEETTRIYLGKSLKQARLRRFRYFAALVVALLFIIMIGGWVSYTKWRYYTAEKCDILAAEIDNNVFVPGVHFDHINSSLAIPACEEAVRNRPQEARLIHNLGRALEVAGRFEDAASRYRQAIALDWAPSKNYLGVAYLYGRGVELDFEAGVALLRAAAGQGLEEAEKNYRKTDFDSLIQDNPIFVNIVQRKLLEAGLLEKAGVTGVWSEGTDFALASFKKLHNIRESGLTLEVIDRLGAVREISSAMQESTKKLVP